MEISTKSCGRCGEQVGVEKAFCPECGAAMVEEKVAQNTGESTPQFLKTMIYRPPPKSVSPPQKSDPRATSDVVPRTPPISPEPQAPLQTRTPPPAAVPVQIDPPIAQVESRPMQTPPPSSHSVQTYTISPPHGASKSHQAPQGAPSTVPEVSTMARPAERSGVLLYVLVAIAAALLALVAVELFIIVVKL